MLHPTCRCIRTRISPLAILTFCLLVLLPWMLLSTACLATEATIQEASQVCRNFIANEIAEDDCWAGSLTAEVKRVEAITSGGDVLGWCFHLAPDGFVIVPSLKELPPVKCFSQTGQPVFGEQQGVGALVRDVLIERRDLYIDFYGDVAVTPQRSDQGLFGSCNGRAWDYLLQESEQFDAAIARGAGERAENGPLLSTIWHQTHPYNIYCPQGDGNRSVVWCVATALAQIMHYHQWPPAGFGNTEYMWNGDQSCEGTSPGLYLDANFSDRYGYSGSVAEMAELCSEVGRAYHVDYGVCYSIGNVDPVLDLLPDWFGYKDEVTALNRNAHTPEDWFGFVRAEIDANRPIQYLISDHMIVADGWRAQDSQSFYHMNYGWGGGNTLWYAVDNLYCTWGGCDPMVERMYTRIEPDRSIMFFADTILGDAPLTVQFTGMSDTTVDKWTWDFGDGNTSFDQNPVHTYENAGEYDVTLTLDVGLGQITRTRGDYMNVLADSVWCNAGLVVPGNSLVVAVQANNTLRLTDMLLPIQYSGDLEIVYDSFSVVGCRTVSCQSVVQDVVDPTNGRLHFHLTPWTSGYSTQPFLEAGIGPLLRLYFTVGEDATSSNLTTVEVNAFSGGEYLFEGSHHGQQHDYAPATRVVDLQMPTCCTGPSRGNVDGSPDQLITMGDLTTLIDHLFISLLPLDCIDEGNVDLSADGLVTMGDLTTLIDHLFISLNSLPPCE